MTQKIDFWTSKAMWQTYRGTLLRDLIVLQSTTTTIAQLVECSFRMLKVVGTNTGRGQTKTLKRYCPFFRQALYFLKIKVTGTCISKET